TSTPCTGKSPGEGRQREANSQALQPSSPKRISAGTTKRSRRAYTRRCTGLALDVEHADQREQAAGSVEIHVDLAFQPFLEQRRRVVVDAAPRHVDGFDLGGRGVANRGIIAVADGEVIAERAAEGGEPQD